MAAAEHAAGSGPTAGEYIIHHLTHLQTSKQTAIVDFSVFNLDSIFFAVLVGVLGSFFLWRAAKSATSGVPGRFQAAVEMLVGVVLCMKVYWFALLWRGRAENKSQDARR